MLSAWNMACRQRARWPWIWAAGPGPRHGSWPRGACACWPWTPLPPCWELRPRPLGRAEALPLPPACLDAVFCECVLSAPGNAPAVLAEAARTLKPGGLLAVSDLYLRGPSGFTAGAARATGGDCLSGALPEAALRKVLDAAGFAELLFEDHSRLLAELAGRLIFAGVSPCGLGGARAPGESARPGYFLCLARRREG